MKRSQRFMSFFLTMATVFLIFSNCIIPVAAMDEETEQTIPSETEIIASGECGQTSTWQIDSNGVMYVEGTGAMYDYWPHSDYQWKQYQPIIQKVVIGEGITRIGNSVFSNCKVLREAVISNSVTVIGNNAFEGCSALTDVYFGNGLQTVGESAFSGCQSLTKMEIPEGVEIIGRYAFYGCTNLDIVVLGESVVSIGERAFAECAKLQEITIPFSLRTIDSFAFQACTNLKRVNYLYTKAWWGIINIKGGNESLLSAEIQSKEPEETAIVTSGECGQTSTWKIDSNGVMYVEGTGAMYDYWPHSDYQWKQYQPIIQKVVIGEGITRIGNSVFSNCKVLREAVISNSVTVIGNNAFEGCSALTDVYFGNGLQTVGESAFSGCQSLKQMEIPERVEIIGDYAFYRCINLEKLVLFNEVRFIGRGGFQDCSNLTIVCEEGSYAETYAQQNNIPYKHYFDFGKTITVCLLNENEEALTSGYTARWYIGEELVGLGNTLYHMDEEAAYRCEVILDYALGQKYIQPDAITFDGGTEQDTLTFSLKPFENIQVSGVVTDENGKGISQANIVFTQTLNDGYQNTITVKTDENGAFAASLLNTTTSMMISADTYYNATQNIIAKKSDKTEMDIGTVVLKKLPSSKITLAYQLALSADKDSEKAIRQYEGGECQFRIFNRTKSMEIIDYVVQNKEIIFGDGMVVGGDVIEIQAWMASDFADVVKTEVTLDEFGIAHAVFTFTEQGYIRYETENDDAVLYIFDENGTLVEKCYCKNKNIVSKHLADGDYQLVLMQNTSLLTNILQLENLRKFGLIENDDFILKTVSVCRGEISVLKDINIPRLDTSKLEYTVPDQTKLTANYTSAAVGRYISLRAEYQISDKTDSKDEYMTLVLPDHVAFIEGSVTLNGKSCTYLKEGNTIRVNVGEDHGIVRCYVMADDAKQAFVEAFIHFSSEKGDLLQPIGSLMLEITDAKLEVPQKTGRTKVPVKGIAIAQSKIEIYCNGIKIAETTANKVGTWNTFVELPNSYTHATYDFYAVITTPTGVIYETTNHTVEYDADYSEVDRVTMINTAHDDTNLDPLEFVTVFHFLEPDNSKHAYNYWPQYPDFTFIVEMTGDNVSEVQVITVNAGGEETVVPCKYDEKTGNWIGTHAYDEFSNIPSSLYVKFSPKDSGSHSFEGEATTENETEDHIYEILASEKAEQPNAKMQFAVQTVSPSIGGIGEVTLCIEGALLEPNAKVILTNGEVEREAATVYWENHQKLYATFKTVGLSDGIYSLSVLCGKNGALLSDCFTVDSTLKAGRISYELHLDDTVKAGDIAKGYISAVNIGSTDVFAPVLALSGENIVFGSDEKTLDKEAIVFLQNYEGLAGTLSAGETAVYSFFYQVPENGKFSLKSLDLGRITSSIDHQTVLKKDSRQEEIFFQYANAMMGATYRDYAESLAKMANALMPADRTLSVSDLEYAYIQNAMNLFSDASVDSICDLTSTNLSLVRSFASGIFECKDGMFGFGWKSQYDVYAEYQKDENGNEQILVFFGGMPAIYTKEEDGTFVSVLSKYEVITRKADGSMILRNRSGVQYEFDTDGKLLSLTDLNGRFIKMTYENGLLIAVSSDNGDTISFTYVKGKVVAATSVTTGEIVEYEYDGELLTKVKTAYGDITYSYQKLSLEKEQYVVNKVLYPDGSFMLYSYDAYGRVTQISDGDISVYYEYGLHEVHAGDSLGNSSTYKHGIEGTLRWVIDASGQVSYYVYDKDSNMTGISYGLFYGISYEYDENRQPVKMIRPDGSIVEYQYDMFGNITSVVDAKQNETLYEYDEKGNPTAIIYADGSKESYTYDEKGRVQTYTKRSGVTVSYTYDDKDNVTKRVYSTGETIAYTYNQFSSVTSITENGQKTEMQYDEKGLLTKIIYPDGKTVSYTYDALGRILSVTDAEGYSTGYVYDGKGYLQNVTDGENTLVTYVYNADGTLKRQTNANGTYTEYVYANGYNTAIMHYGADGSVISSYVYTYDDLGNISSMTDLNGTWYYTYDALSQLIGSTAPDGTYTQYRYDAAGNRTEVTVDGKKTTAYETNALNQYTSYGDTVCEYDINGNLIRKTTAKGTETYDWDYMDRLVKYTAPDGTVYEYGYDAFGLRNKVTVNGKTTNYLNDPTGYGYTLTEYRADETVHYNIVDGIVASQNGDQTYYYNANHLGSVTEITDQNGKTVNAYTYNHEGDILSKTEGISNPFTYVGIYGIINDENGLIYDRARYVSTETDSFISVDPLGQNADLNVYRYVANNPVMFVDISGEASLWPDSFNDLSREEKLEMVDAIYDCLMISGSNYSDRYYSLPMLGEELVSRMNTGNGYVNGILMVNRNEGLIERLNEETKNALINGDESTLSSKRKLDRDLVKFNMEPFYLDNWIGNIWGFRNPMCRIPEDIDSNLMDENFSVIQTASGLNDPSGYVYEGVTSNRLEGVKATIYYEGYLLDEFGEIDYEAGLQMIEWTEASEYNEVNPQITDVLGRYGWDVLPGKWIVKYEKDGYDIAWSEWMEVPPEYTDVNINMMTQSAPTVSSVIAYKDYILISFSQYMDISSITNQFIQITADGAVVKGTFVPMDAEYNFEKTAQYASVFKFVPDSELTSDPTLIIAKVSNYASLVMNEMYWETVALTIEPESIVVSEKVKITYGETKTLTVQVLPGNIGAGVKVQLISYSPSKLAVLNEIALTDENGKAVFEIEALLPGEIELVVKVDGTEISETVKCVISDVDGEFEEEPDVLLGDMNGDETLNSADAIYLLRHTIMPSLYPLEQPADVNGDGVVNSADAIYLLRHTIMPNLYPLARK